MLFPLKSCLLLILVGLSDAQKGQRMCRQCRDLFIDHNQEMLQESRNNPQTLIFLKRRPLPTCDEPLKRVNCFFPCLKITLFELRTKKSAFYYDCGENIVQSFNWKDHLKNTAEKCLVNHNVSGTENTLMVQYFYSAAANFSSDFEEENGRPLCHQKEMRSRSIYEAAKASSDDSILIWTMAILTVVALSAVGYFIFEKCCSNNDDVLRNDMPLLETSSAAQSLLQKRVNSANEVVRTGAAVPQIICDQEEIDRNSSLKVTV
ncbi:unnamed protein product [Caenorhabditis auriculariae]|uniref:Uncharacterized protein n=1 Tax=Caenorhabditis auriculariae TaxID=2777116 RepID=A0A8S1H7X7_9PELO|nr:unnamed protein product [Caenorhabditis auriculariae]